MSMSAAADNVETARTAFASLTGRILKTRESCQAALDHMCGWLRLVRGQRTGPAQGPLDDLAREVVNFAVSHYQLDPLDDNSFSGLNLNLSGIPLGDINFANTRFSGGIVSFRDCIFGSRSSFEHAVFSGAEVTFDGAHFEGTSQQGGGLFAGCRFAGSTVSFASVQFHGGISFFDDAVFESGFVDFSNIRIVDSLFSFVRSDFCGANVSFAHAVFERGFSRFNDCRIRGGMLSFNEALFRMPVSFNGALVDGGVLSFRNADVYDELSLVRLALRSGELSFEGCISSGGIIDCRDMTVDGGKLVLDGLQAKFGIVDLSQCSFLGGSVTAKDVGVFFDAEFKLPWARFTSSGKQVLDASFDGLSNHDFRRVVARYSEQVNADWEHLKP